MTAVSAAAKLLPLAGLYRHVARLVDAGVLIVVAERRVRGALERTYVLRPAAARIDPAEIAEVSPEERRQAFLAFVAGMMGDVDRYLVRDDADPLRDGVGFSTAAMWLDDAECAVFLRELAAVVQTRLANAPGPERTRRILNIVLLKGDSGTR
jgi:hypothetical protein